MKKTDSRTVASRLTDAHNHSPTEASEKAPQLQSSHYVLLVNFFF